MAKKFTPKLTRFQTSERFRIANNNVDRALAAIESGDGAFSDLVKQLDEATASLTEVSLTFRHDIAHYLAQRGSDD